MHSCLEHRGVPKIKKLRTVIILKKKEMLPIKVGCDVFFKNEIEFYFILI